MQNARKQISYIPVGGKPWIELLGGITVEDLTTISIQVLELVQPKKGMDSEMAFKMIRKDLEEMSREGAAAPDAKRQKTSYMDSRECS
mmetsp:Transcript_8265/g.13060  ORF Transcript_8265/g.13060 Transcript_8265/m.13060 type:complete len:88 (+) Transcript_8265:814-1077(+)